MSHTSRVKAIVASPSRSRNSWASRVSGVVSTGGEVCREIKGAEKVFVNIGDTVEPGQLIGYIGNTGRSSGPHLHWEMVVNGQWIDSADFMQLWLP